MFMHFSVCVNAIQKISVILYSSDHVFPKVSVYTKLVWLYTQTHDRYLHAKHKIPLNHFEFLVDILDSHRNTLLFITVPSFQSLIIGNILKYWEPRNR